MKRKPLPVPRERITKTICSITGKGTCRGCKYSVDPNLYDGGCTRLREREILPNPAYELKRYKRIKRGA